MLLCTAAAASSCLPERKVTSTRMRAAACCSGEVLLMSISKTRSSWATMLWALRFTEASPLDTSASRTPASIRMPGLPSLKSARQEVAVMLLKRACILQGYQMHPPPPPQGFPNMPFVKCLSGFAEVSYQVPPWSLPDAPRMPRNKSQKLYLVQAPKARFLFVSQGSCCEVPPRVCRGTVPGTAPFPPEHALKTYLVPGWKARLSARHVWKTQTPAQKQYMQDKNLGINFFARMHEGACIRIRETRGK